jgi:hypothetical protein
MPHDSLHGGQVGAAHEQERRRRVAEVMEADLSDLADREELKGALRAATEVRVAGRLAVPAALAPALVDVASDQARPAHGPTEHLLKFRVLRQHAAVLGRKDPLGRRGRDRALQVDEQLGIDRDRVNAAVLRNVAVVRAADQDEPGKGARRPEKSRPGAVNGRRPIGRTRACSSYPRRCLFVTLVSGYRREPVPPARTTPRSSSLMAPEVDRRSRGVSRRNRSAPDLSDPRPRAWRETAPLPRDSW